MSRQTPHRRRDFGHFLAIPTRWMDNDIYGHVNNVVYYSYFDTVVNRYLIEAGALDIGAGAIVGLVVETQCSYFSPIVFPDTVYAGLRVARLGNTSVRYDIALFRNDDQMAAAQGHFVHAYVNRASNRPVQLPEALKQALQPLVHA
jgi:acyl-CoA thioester hydrolase